MIYLFDASSISKLLVERMEDAVAVLNGESTLDLALYELGNVVWKESRSAKRPGDEVAKIIGYIEQVLDVMEIKRIQVGDMRGMERNALSHGLTFYDSAYLSQAIDEGLTLITEDGALRKAAASTGASCLTITEFESK